MNAAMLPSSPVGAASHLATTEVPVLLPDERVDEVRRRLSGRRFVTARDLPVCDRSGVLVGVARIEDVLAAPGAGLVREIMDPDPPTVTADTDEEVAAWHAVRHGESSLVLLDEHGGLVGVVPPDRLLDVLLQEHEQDVARLGGFLASARSATDASKESVGHRLAHRLPWLLVGLAGALASAGLMGGFESLLRTNLLLTLFVPGIIYLADAVGTQTEALVVRGLAIGIPIRSVVFRELATGVLAGVLLGALFLAVGVVIWGDLPVAIIVALALAIACATANAVAMALPALLAQLGIDPAFGSGPLATVIQDLLSLAIYVGIAVWLL